MYAYPNLGLTMARSAT